MCVCHAGTPDDAERKAASEQPPGLIEGFLDCSLLVGGRSSGGTSPRPAGNTSCCRSSFAAKVHTRRHPITLQPTFCVRLGLATLKMKTAVFERGQWWYNRALVRLPIGWLPGCRAVSGRRRVWGRLPGLGGARCVVHPARRRRRRGRCPMPKPRP